MKFINGSGIPDKYRKTIQSAQINYVYDTIPIQVIINVIAGIAIAYVLIDIRSLSWVLSWYLPFCLILFHRLWAWRLYNQSSDNEKNNIKWGHYLNWNVIAFALSWVYFFQVFFDPNLPQYNAFLIVVIAGVTAGGFSSLSAYVKTFINFALIALIPMSLRLIVEGGKLNDVLGVLSILFSIVLILFARKAHKHYQLSLVAQLKYRDISKELEHQRSKAEKSDTAKSRFLSTVSHDVRQPLHALHLFIQTLKKQNTNQDLDPLVNNISKTSNSIRWFFSQLLDYSRVDSRSIKPKYKVFPLSEVLDRLFIEYEIVALEKGLDFRIVPSTVLVDVDPLFLERILRNLISNAIRYTQNGRVLLGCRRKKRTVQIEVHDTGLGVSSENHEKIFEEFYQSAVPGNKNKKGAGLGLSIASGLAGLMNTSIQLKSSVGKGSCFSIELTSVRNTHNPQNKQQDKPSDSSLLNAQIHLYCDKVSNQHLINTVKLWSPDGVISSQVNRVSKIIDSEETLPDVVIFDDILFRKDFDLEKLKQDVNSTRNTIPIIILTDQLIEKKSRDEQEDQLIYRARKPIKPAMLRLLIEQVM